LKNRWVNVVFDPYITRWLDYYTWVVFETFIDGKMNFGSICSGGRYDNLVWAIRQATNSKWREFEGVWWSIGLSRFFSVLEDLGLLKKELNLIDIIVFNLDCSIDYREKIINKLKQTNKNFDIFYNKTKLDKQFKYAENKNIPFWIFAWKTEENSWEVMIKDLENRTSKNIKLENLEKYFK
jgi:histidyl-tRNA synthetase